MYYIFFGIVFMCFAFHTAVHVLEHYRKLPERKVTHAAIGTSMFFGWFSYFYMSFSGFSAANVTVVSYAGLLILAGGLYLFIVSHARVHKRMHGGKGKLVTDGIYRHLRHPMYLGEILMLLGAPILGQSILTLLLSPVFIIQILVWRQFEEQELVKEFPEYAGYRKRTLF
jgi:protein-S-isoprenylcysteine O-methyltransferase Ste14